VVFVTACATDELPVTASTAQPIVTTIPTPTVASATTTAPPSTGPTTPAVSTIPLVEGSIVLTPYSDGFSLPVDLAWRKGDPALYVVEQDGRILPVVEGVRGSAVLDVGELLTTGGERGLLGLAFHPELPLAYINYTDSNGDTVIAEFALGADGGFDAASRRTVISIGQPYPNHNGGDLAFGPDGMLYIGMGDGGAGGDPERHSLALDDLLGKMLRINPLASGDAPYTVPADNPFVGVDGAAPEIWSIGLRNPWRFNFDRASGDLWIGDVGQGDWEEVNVARASDGAGRGVNFGWSAFEGTHPFNDDQRTEGAVPPVHEYSHADGCSISGGTVYRGNAIESLRGWYLFSDYCSGTVWGLLAIPGTPSAILTLGAVDSASAIADGPDGELYVLNYSHGTVLRVDAVS
jgi:glucose/arabinose dehydrogenase